MLISTLTALLKNLDTLTIKLPDGSLVPSHFHVTEVGMITKDFIDCGGTLRSETKVSLQLWSADDYDHRLHPDKLIDIISLSQDKLRLPDAEIEVEYQGADTIQKFGLQAEGDFLQLTSLTTDCLAKDKCDVPNKQMINLDFVVAGDSCTPGGGCC